MSPNNETSHQIDSSSTYTKQRNTLYVQLKQYQTNTAAAATDITLVWLMAPSHRVYHFSQARLHCVSHFNHLQGKPTQLELIFFSTATPDEAKCYVQSSIEFQVLKLEFRALTE